jgi:hypothetical protein
MSLFRLTKTGRAFFELFVNGDRGDPAWLNWISTNLSTIRQQSLWEVFRHCYMGFKCTTTPGWIPKFVYIGAVLHFQSHCDDAYPNVELDFIKAYIKEHVEDLMDELHERGFIVYATDAITLALCQERNVDPITFAPLPIAEAVPSSSGQQPNNSNNAS